MEKRLTKIIVSLLILVINLSFCVAIGNYCLNKNKEIVITKNKEITTTLNIEDEDTVINEQLNPELLNKHEEQYIIIENYIVENLSYDKEKVTLSTHKSKKNTTKSDKFDGLEISIDIPTINIYIKMQDTNKTLKHQLKKGDKITIYGKLIKSEEFKDNCCDSQGKNYSLSLSDYKITNIDTSNEVKMPTSTDGYYNDNSYIPNPETLLSNLTKWENIKELQRLHKKNYPETDRQVAINLTSTQIKQDESEDYKILSQYNGKYIRISDYKYNDWDNVEEWIGDSRTEKITAIRLRSNLIKSEETGSFKPIIDIVSILDSSDTTTLKHLLKKGDKITIEGKLDEYNLDSNYIRLTNCRIIE